jgi:hypothetical protein
LIDVFFPDLNILPIWAAPLADEGDQVRREVGPQKRVSRE